MSATFYTAIFHLPGHLPDSDSPPPVFKDYSEAAAYLADELDCIASGFEEGERHGDRFEAMAADCSNSTEEDGFATDGPDGYRYAVEETESRGRWTTGPEDHGAVVVTFTEREDGLGPTARDAADEVSSLCGSSIEQPRGDSFAYAMIDSGRLSEAAEELRDSGFELEDLEGELVA